MNVEVGSLVVFKTLKNARGYLATGEVLDVAGDTCTVEAYGLYGPGSTTTVREVPVSDLHTEGKSNLSSSVNGEG